MSSTPYIGFGSDTLNRQPKVGPGDTFECPRCGEKHEFKSSFPPGLLYYHCQGRTYLGGIDGRSTVGAKADVAGRIDLDEPEATP